MEGNRKLLQLLRKELPREAFQNRPQGAWLALLWIAVLVAGTWAIAAGMLPWYAALLVGILLGQAYACLGFLAHEALHGTLFASKWKQDMLGYLGFWLLGFTPTLWRVWHNQVHHGHTNYPDQDPDSFGTLKRWRELSISRFEFTTSLGSGHFSSWFFFFYHLSYHAQCVLWVHSKFYAQLFKTLNRRRAIAESLAIYLSWILFALFLGFPGFIFAWLVPWLVANFILMSYISTNHLLRPLLDHNDPLKSSLSLNCSPWIDRLHCNFSHHVEHHLFPAMNWKYTPLVRKKLREHAPESYLCPRYWQAIAWLYKTPRLYEDAMTLINPYQGIKISLASVELELKND